MKHAVRPDPFTLSKPYAIDPAYATDRVLPSPLGLSLFSKKTTGPFWLYAQGDLEACLFQRACNEAYSAWLNGCYPGRYRMWHSVLYARRTVKRAARPADTMPCVVFANGCIQMTVNDRTVLHAVGTAKPTPYRLDLAACLQAQDNRIFIRVFSLAGPPTVLLDAPNLASDQEWQVGWDGQIWEAPNCLPFEGDAAFPHQEEIPELTVTLSSRDGTLFDAGVNLLGRPILDATGDGDVAIRAGESVEETAEAGDEIREQADPPPCRVANGVAAPIPTSLAFRYLRITPGPRVQLQAVRAAAALYPATYRGAFACADETLTRVWMHAAYTLRASMQLLLLDGLKRDRMPWVGDAYVGNLGGYLAFHERRLAERTLTALMGEDPETVDLNGIVSYSLFWILAARNHALHFADEAFCARMAPFSDRLLAALKAKSDPDGLLASDRFTWLFVDWAPVATAGHSAFLNCLYVMALEAASDLHRFAGHPDQAGSIRQAAVGLRERCRDRFWDEPRRCFVDNAEGGVRGTSVSRQVNSFAILSGVATEAQHRGILGEVLLNSALAPVGTPFMAYFEALALGECGKRAEMLDAIRTYWGGMLDAGASTFWEGYDATHTGAQHYAFYGRPYGKSLCHAWSCGPLHLLSGALFGLRPLAPGWTRCAMDLTPSAQEWSCAAIPTPLGEIGIRVTGSRATVEIPAGMELDITGAQAPTRHRGPATIVLEENAGGKQGSRYTSVP